MFENGEIDRATLSEWVGGVNYKDLPERLKKKRGRRGAIRRASRGKSRRAT